MIALSMPATAQTGTGKAASTTKYMAVAWEGDGYLVTENGGKSWKLVSGNALASLPAPLLKLLAGGSVTMNDPGTLAMPNPAIGPVDLRFSVNEPGRIAITVHDVRGDEVLRESRETSRAGLHTHRLDLSTLPSGLYYYRLLSGSGPIGGGPITVAR